MTKSGDWVDVPSRHAERILTAVLRFRKSKLEKPDDVNFLLSLFPSVSLRRGYVLDYVTIDASVAGWIVPYARREQDPPLKSAPRDIHVFDRHTIAGYEQGKERDAAEVERLYRHLAYEPTPAGLFEYAFFILELSSTHASWHAAEWLDSSPVFTKRRFDAICRHPWGQSFGGVSEDPPTEGLALGSRVEHFAPRVRLGARGGHVSFLVFSPIGVCGIYRLECTVHPDGRVECLRGDAVADFGPGAIY